MGAGAIVVIVAIIATTAGVGGYVVVNDYLPINNDSWTNLDVIPPVGNYTEISEDQMFSKYPFIEDMFDDAPHRDNVLYAGFETDASIQAVMAGYQSKLLVDGYSFYKQGTYDIYGYTVYYTSYIKGLTGVGIVANNQVDEYDTLVGYITGDGRDLSELVDWFENEVV